MALKDGGASDLPAWARRIRAERAARGWSQQQAAEALRAHAGENARLAEKASLLRNWNTGMDALEIISRLRVSDVSPAVLEGMPVAIEQLNNDYSHVEPAVLVEEGQRWLNRPIALHNGRLSLEQHREVLSPAGEVARLVGCVEYDMGRKAAAEATRRADRSRARQRALRP
jgi:hypothetical protein